MFNVRSNSMVKSNKKFGPIIITAIMSVIFLLSALLFIVPVSEAPTAYAATTVGNRVTPLELMSVHQVDWVMGPIANGYTDTQGNATNNAYGIPANRYFNINNYLYIDDDTSSGEKILRGWKNNIIPVALGDSGTTITQDGYIQTNKNGEVTTSTNLGIYISRTTLGGRDSVPAPSTNKYMLIMPDEITQIGTGSGVFNGKRPTGGGTNSTEDPGAGYNFTDFAFYLYPGNNVYGTFDTSNKVYWSPRERLAGVYFNSTSRLKSISGGEDASGKTYHRYARAGKPAFAGCDNTKFFVLPNNTTLTSIGNYAFDNCSQMRDFNIPSNVTSIGQYAFRNCSSMPHLTIPSKVTSVGTGAFANMSKLSDVESHSSKVTAASFSGSRLLNFYTSDNGSQLYMVGNDENDTGANGYYLCKNLQGYSGTLATVTNGGSSESYQANNWYVVALAGKDDTTATVVRRFPKQVAPDDPRRSSILYDYLNSDGSKCKNTLGDETISKYDIGNDMADSTWCCNAVLPPCVEIIGDNAFHYSHTVYMETSATTIGKDAFSSNADVDTPGDLQSYYIHKAVTKYGADVFAGAPGSGRNLTRRFIFETRALYNTYANANGTLKTGNVFASNHADVTKECRYQIPIIANVVSTDGDVNIITGDIDTRFDYDADYATHKSVTGADADGNGTYNIMYTKRLNGFDFDVVKTELGTWNRDSSIDHAKPVIQNMKSTVWYTDTNYTTTTDAANRYTNTATSVTIYTKKIAKPTIVDTEYTFGDENIPKENIELLDLNANPSYKTDYVAKISAFAYVTGTQVNPAPSEVVNAGQYTVVISLNPTKWGEWTPEYAERERTGTVVVKRKTIDLGDLSNIPTFSAGGVDLGGDGAGAALYRYDTGWYLYSQSGSQIGDTIYANNAYTRYTANSTHITTPDDWNKYNISPGTGDHYGTDSRDYYATFNLSVPFIDGTNGETNFEFVYDSESANASLFSLYGLVLDNKTITTASLRKTWYIVMQSNWFIDSTETLNAENPYATPPYALALNSDNNSVRTWTYEDVLDIRTPKLAYNQDYSTGSAVTVSPSFSVYYNGTEIVEDESDLTKLKYYINPSMPAGTYSIVVSAPEIQGRNEEGQPQTYPAISDSIQIVVTPKSMDTDDLQAALYNDGNTYEFPYDMGKHLYYKDGDAGYVANSGVDYELTELNRLLNVKLAGMQADNYWATTDAAAYFGEAQLTYNLDRLGTSSYSAYENVAPMNVDQYIVYYCISAKNYITVGGENDADRRDKAFYTLIYNEILVSSLFGSQNDSAQYLQDLIYDGTPRYTSVPYNQLYRSEYTDADYVNAHKDATVTVTLLNPVTSRWKYDLTDADQTSRVPQPAADANQSVIVAKYDILPAQNGWAVSPQMPSWSFNGFNRGINVVASGLQFAGADVMYRLGLLDEDSEEENIVWTHYFKVNANGVVISGSTDGVNFDISQADIISELNLLKPGNYYLQSKVADIKVGEAVNVTGGEFVAQNPGGGMLATVNISKATNRWTRSPNIVRWTWSEYTSARHVISSTALYPSLLSSFFTGNGIATPVAEYQILRYVDEGNGAYSYIGIDGLSVKDGEDFWFTAVNDDIAAILGGLDAGDYVLRARLNGNEYYTDIEEQDGIFDIARATNSWKYSPNVVRWDWSNYNSSVNVITATPVNMPEGAAVHYTILDGDYELADNALRNFTEVTATIAGVLGGLPAGDYYLVAALEGTNNYLAINDWDTVTEQEKPEEYSFGSVYDFADVELNKQLAPIQFSIGKINNSWEITPGMTGWQYKDFAESNFIAGTPTNTPAGESVLYTVTAPDNTTFDLEYTEVNNQTGEIQLAESTIGRLTALGKGTYKLSASLDGTDNYSPLNYETTFTVFKADNSWSTAPGLTGWVYGAFAATNFTPGVPTLTESKNEDGSDALVTYTITKNGDSAFTAITFTELPTATLNSLGYGSYTMTVSYSGTDNYDELPATVTFTVSQVANSWTTSPGMTGWQYKNFSSSNFIVGTPKYGTTVAYVLTGAPDGDIPITYDKDIDTGVVTIDEEVFAALNALPAGNYTFKATVAAADSSDYGALEYTATVTVMKATNVWVYSPGMTSWSYKGFVDNFVAGTPTFGDATDVTYKVSGNGIEEIALGFDTEDGVRKLSSATVAALNALSVYGSYKLTAHLDGTLDYSDLDYDATFSVSKINNTWATTPGMTGWEYLGYVPSNFRAGAPTLIEDEDAKVTYTLYSVTTDSEGNENATPKFEKFTSDNLPNFAELEVGRYRLVAEYPGNTNYYPLSQPITFSVTSATNKWTTYPGMTGWAYLGYTSGNFRAGVVAFSDALDADGNPEVVKYKLYELTGDGDTVSERYITEFKQSNEYDFLHLNVGNYKIHASLKGTDNYPDLTYDFEFSVTAINNTWSTSPILTGWTYGQFAESNFRAAVPTHNEAYGKDSENNPLYRSVTYTLKLGDTVIDTVEFKFNADGTLHSDTVNALKKLSANAEGESYTLEVAFEGNGNYRDLTQNVTFRVTTATNTWATTPGMTGWVYGAYTPSNFRAGAPTLTEDEAAKVTYTLYSVTTDSEGNEDATLKFEKLTSDKLPDFAELEVGSYRLVAEYPKTNNYGALSQPITFSVTKATNRWTTNPGMTGWAYLGYVSSNFRAGVAALNDATEDDGSTAVVKYTLYSVKTEDDGQETETPIGNTFTASNLYDFNSLGAGRYKIYASLKGTTNYDDLTQPVEFTVTKTNNSWTATPGMTSWSYMAFTAAGNFTAGDPYLEEVATEKVSYTITKVGDSNFNAITFTDISTVKTKLESLAVGSYIMTAIYPGTDNYNELVRENITFGVNKIQNTWATAPGLTGWVFESFDLGNFTAGIPTLTESNNEDGSAADVVYTVTKTGETEVLAEFVGIVKDDDTYVKLNALGRGNYTMTVTYLGTANYEPLDATVTFTVSQVANSWQPSPGMTGWQYKNFASTNFIVGKPKYGTTVTYVLKGAPSGDITIIYDKAENGAITIEQTVFDKLNALPAGSYTFTATVTGTLDYGDLVYEATVSVLTTSNTWATAPVLTGWVFGSFSADNFTAGVPTLTDDNTAKVAYTVTKLDGSKLTLDYDVNQETGAVTLTKESIDALNALGRGNYTMTVTYPKTDNYSALNTPVTFTVSQVANSWTISPGMTGWQYKNFSSTNFIVGKPKYGTTVTYKLNETVITYDTVGEDGVVTIGDTVFSALNALPVGKYTFTATVEGTTDYAPLTYSATVTVMKAANTWERDPGMTSWSYKGYTAAGNFTAGIPTLRENTDAVVTYVITKVGDSTFTAITFTDIETVKTQLEGLAVGSYTMTATYPGTDNYDTLNRGNITFSVNKIQNTWATRPGLTGWVYESFNAANFTAGVPTLTESKNQDGSDAEVEYTITKDGDNTFTAITFTKLSDVQTKLEKLAVGSYTMTVTYPGTVNYDPLDPSITFTVSQRTNSWSETPRLSSYRYSQFAASSNFAAGEPYYPTDDKTIGYGIFTKNLATSALFTAENSGVKFNAVTDNITVSGKQMTVEEYLNTLSVGNYWFAAYVAGTNEYTELYTCTEFVVNQATNSWTSGKVPFISGWTYGEYTGGLFTAGEATFGAVLYTVQMVNDAGNIITGENGIAKINNNKLENMTSDDLASVLSQLGAGRYNLHASTGDTVNYTAATQDIRFSVAMADNSWKDDAPPTIEGWTYGSTPKQHSNASANVNTGAIVYEYYRAQQVNGEWIPYGDNITSLTKETEAGDYVMKAIVPANANYNSLTHTVHFTIAKQANKWNPEPEDRLDWTWGNTDKLESSKLYGAYSRAPEGGVTYVFANEDGIVINTVTVKYLEDEDGDSGLDPDDKAALLQALRGLGVGNYRITTTFNESTNCNALSKVTSVTVSAATFGVVKAPACAGWTWGEADGNKKYDDIEIGTVVDGDPYTVRYTLGVKGQTAVDTYDDADEMFDELKGSNANTYVITVIVTGANYNELRRTVEVTIGKASFTWVSKPTDMTWTWREPKEIVTPSAEYATDEAVLLSYTIKIGDSPVVDYGTDFVRLKNLLTNGDVGTYSVTVSAIEGEGYDYKLVNYNTFGTSFTVTVTKATNVWTENTPAARYEREYQNKDINVPESKAKFGTVIYRDENGDQLTGAHGAITTVEALNELLNGLAANGNTPFVYYTVVEGTTNYDTISVKTEVFVTGTKSKWQNTVELTDRITFDFSARLSADFAEKVNAYIPIGPSAGTTTYTISYVNYDGENPDQNGTAITSAADVLSWLQGKGKAGTYVIYSHYKPEDNSYTPLEHTLTVKVNRVRPQWDVTLDSSYTETYGNIVVPNPTVKIYSGAEIKITVTDATNKVYPIPVGTSLSEFVKTLNAGVAYYSVSYVVEETEDYYGVAARQSMLYILPIVNSWNDSTIGEDTVAWANGYTWEYTRGATISVVLPTAVVGNETMKIIWDGAELGYTTAEALNGYLNRRQLAAGSYSLVFSIEQTVNYNGLASNCTIVVKRQTNSWTTELSSYVGEGNVSGFTLPATDNHTVTYNGKVYDLLRFDVSRADGKYSRPCMSLSDFEDELETFANGTYTVTAYVGGNGYASSLSDDYKAALALYNADYEPIVTTCTITLTPHANDWDPALIGHSWTWGEFDASEITKPVATYGNDDIVYTIKSGNTTVAEIKASKYTENGADEAFVAFKTALAGLDAGTYSVTVSIDGSDVYYAPVASSAVFIVSQATSEWTLSDTELSEFEVITATWGGLKESDFPTLILKEFATAWNGEGSAVVYSIGADELVDDKTTQGVNEGSWIYGFGSLDAGTYTITATVRGDKNHTPLTFRARVIVSPITSVWDSTTSATDGGESGWVYNSAANVRPAQPVIGVPQALRGDWDTTPTYTLTKKNQNGTLQLYSGNSWSDMLDTLDEQPGGEYTLTAHIDGDVNHTALNYTYTITVSAATNSWNKNMSGKVDENNAISWVHGLGGTAIEYEAEFNNSKLVVTVNGDVVTDFDSLKYYNVGEYSIVATVAADESYSGLTETIKLKITKAPNTWNSNIAIQSWWTWDDINQVTGGWNIGFGAPVPAQGLSASVTVSDGTTVVLEATINYSVSTGGVKTANQNDVAALVRRLCALDVGNYTISITVGETDNYTALADQTASFEIRKATNRWETGKSPMIEGWSIDGDTAYPSATPVFGKGTVVFSYTEATEDQVEPPANADWVAAPAYAEGSYWLRATVEGTANYSSLTGYYKFIIGAGKNAWVNNPGVTAWDWDNYDKDVNLFSGSARSNGKATFTVTKANGTEAGLPLKAEDFNPTDKTLTINADAIAKLEGFELDAAGKVSDDVAKLLKALKHGSYRLNVTVAAGSNLDSISGGANFTVGRAENTWANDAQSKPIAPSIRYYTYGDTDVFTAGVTTYGAAVSYRITSGTTYTSDVMDGDRLEEFLLELPAGSYVLRAWATAADTADYRSLYSEDSSYQVAFVVSPKDNVFTTKPKTKISEYYANIHTEGFDIDTWLGRPEAEYGAGEEIYTVLNTDYTPINNKTYTYEQFKKAVLEDLGSGEYIVRITVEASTNYRVLTEDVSLTISRRTNRFTVSPDKLTGQWKLGADGHNASELNPVTVRAEHGDVTFTLNNVTYDSFSELAEAVKALDASSYQVTYSVEQTDAYAGLTKVVQLDIRQATNAWKNSWTIGSSLTVSSATKAGTTITWAWHSDVIWTNAVPTYGNTVYVEIKTKGASSSLRYITIDYGVANYADAIDTVCSALSGLDVGTYVMTVTAPAGSNWTQLSSSTEFSITPISNRWTSECTIIGAEKSGEIFTVVYGNTALPSATALYGTTVYSYRNAVTGESLDSMPTDAGTYTIVFEVPEPAAKNYGVLTKEVTLEIIKASVTSFIVSPGTTGWIWGDYNRLSNVFTGIPTSGGKVSYTILDKDGDVVTVEKVTVEQDGETKTVDVVLDGIVLGDISDKHYDDFDKDVYVSTLVGAAISKLKSGTYTLRINVAATENNDDFTATTTFVVTAAENVWTTPPQVVSWVSNNWNADEYMPKAISRFGNPHIVIRSSVTDDVYFEANYNSVTGKLEIVGDNLLNRAPTGWYNMRATVEASENEYNNKLDNTISFQIFAQGSPDEKNYWIDTPGIEPWAANIEDKINLPYGKPARGLPYFLFYKAEYNGTSYTRGELVTEGELAHTVSKYDEETGVDRYYQDFYVPIAPGYYYMVACAVSVDINGNVVEKDNLNTDKTPMLFEIFNRDNSWEQDVRITSLLYLGERKDWAGPNAKAYLPDSEITYKYLDAETREDLGSEMPSKPGKYIVVASAKARFSATITSEIDFEVRYSKNYWVGDKSPTIENWSEEFSATSPDPVGEAMFGEVVYTYVNKADPDTILTEKPTQEGEYTMIARVEIEGYETLESPYDFTITSAYDRTFVVIDIILGVTACSMAVVVFIFAVRRYKEN